MARSLPPDIQAKIEKLYDEGYGKAEIARRVGVHANTVYRLLKNGQRDGGQLSPEASRALVDFSFFRSYFLGRVTLPWHVKAADMIVDLLATEEREYLVQNVPPGAGKSTLLIDVCTWLICRDRAVRILYGSAVQSMAEDYSYSIMNNLTREDPFRATEKEQRYGLAVDATMTLEQAYGRFKPTNGARWTKGKFTVAQNDNRTVQNKEATVVAYGYDSGFLGGRYDLCVWDDLVTTKNMRTEDAADLMRKWWEDTAETRLEPGGLVVLNGQRLNGDDLYRYALDLDGGDDFLNLTDEIGTDPDAEPVKKYQHIKFPAHDEQHCKGQTVVVKGKPVPNPDHAVSAKAWPDGCLLDPVRLSMRFLAPKMRSRDEHFRIVYQQEDVDPGNALVKPIWIDGGEHDGITYPGCKNPNRMMWQLPQMVGTRSVYMTVDPSPTKNWSIQLWVYHHLTEKRFLLAHYRGPLSSPDWLDWNLTGGRFVGLAEEWWQRAYQMGVPFTSMVVEKNAAQEFMLQSDFIQRWSQQRQVLLVPHKTHANKGDPEFGVQMLAPLFQHGLIDLPWKGTEALKCSGYLINEALKWPHGSYEDCIMSMWFGEHNLARIKTPEAQIIQFKRPSWLVSA